MVSRPLSQNEVKARSRDEIVVIYNTSKQSIPIQLRAPMNPKTGKRVGFFTGEQTVSISKGKSSRFPKSRLYMEQVNNLQRSGMVRVSKSTNG